MHKTGYASGFTSALHSSTKRRIEENSQLKGELFCTDQRPTSQPPPLQRTFQQSKPGHFASQLIHRE